MDSPTNRSRVYTPSNMTASNERQDSYTTYMSKHHPRLITSPSTTITNPVTSPSASDVSSPTSTNSSTVASPDAAPMPPSSTSFFTALGTTTPSMFSSSSPAARTTRATSLDLPVMRPAAGDKLRNSSVTSISTTSSSSAESSASRTSAETARRYSAMTESFASLSPRHSVGSGRRWVRGGSVDDGKREWERERRVAEEMELERRFLGV